jgi:hypothetical protein
VRGELGQIELRGILFDNMPHNSLGHPISPGLPSPANTPEDSTSDDSCCHNPFVDTLLHPFWNWNGPNMTTLSDQVHYGPVVVTTLEEIKGQIGEFLTTQASAQQDGKKRCVALAFEGLGSGRLPKTSSFLSCQPITKPHAQFACSLDTANACGEFRAQ